MTENEAIEVIGKAMKLSEQAIIELTNIKEIAERQQKVGEYYTNLKNCVKEIDACKIAIKALQEIKQYREIGTVNEFKNWKEDWLNKFESLIEYRKIGTVEECREAREKQKAKKPDYEGDGYADGHLVYDTWICPCCEERYEVEYDDYKHCPNCGQAIDWRNEE